tara:strand:- start:902 stop:2170 length:1269 start_codon:yes stop_codon:yes gene_type:complete
MQLVWAQNVVQKTNSAVLIITPLAVANQTQQESDKFGITAKVNRGDGEFDKSGIIITNYEQLHRFDPNDFAGVVCDESSILKSFQGETRKRLTRFMAKTPYRLLCTATAAPNDYVELGTSSEAIGELSHSDMLKRFFKMLDDKGQKQEKRHQDQAEVLLEADPNYFRKLSFRVAQTIGQWRLKHHAIEHFWRWVASWSIACRMPSDIGFEDEGFILPELNERDHVIRATTNPPGMLFNKPAIGMGEERAERRRTIAERTEFVADCVNHDRPAVIWCHMNCEADRLEEVIPDARQIAGKTPDERKIELYDAFQSGELKKLVIKPKIGAWGLNWQHCNHVVTFPSHSYEQYYQSIRRCYRFGQENPVQLDVVATEGELRVLGNMRRKAEKANGMFAALVKSRNDAERIEREDIYTKPMEVPKWL